MVATPIGNPGDLSPRAKEMLERADCVLAEDTRRTGLLLTSCGVKATQFLCLNDYNEDSRLEGVLQELAQGREMALVSDAGTPLLSDPGYRLVRACRERDIPVSPVPGPAAPLAALSASGLPPLPFVFLAFPPRKTIEQRKFFAPYAELSITSIFFERKDRLKETLGVVYELYGEREVCIAREITKTYEEFLRFSLSGYRERCTNLLGEITVIIGPPLERVRPSQEEALAVLRDVRQANDRLKLREAAKLAASRLKGWSVAEIYDLGNR